MQKLVSSFLCAVALTVPLLIPSTAHAGLEACGNIHVEANAQCEATVTGGCDVQCQEFSFEASCHASGYVSCEGECSGSARAECIGQCDVSACEAKCNVNPGQFDCEANCVAGCDAECSGSCEAKCKGDSGCKSQCQGSCKATCQGECNGGCTGTPPSADCKAKCDASCTGQCSARANFECQVDCQARAQAQCVTNLEGGCVARCESPEGALVCDGEYMDQDGNAQACLDAIADWAASLNVSASGSATSSCEGNMCSASAEGEASCSCGVPKRSNGQPWGLFAALAAVGLGVARRRFS
jgi:hypothetical protein